MLPTARLWPPTKTCQFPRLAVPGTESSTGAAPASAQSPSSVTVETADTPAEHKALAEQYKMQAAGAKETAQKHREMGSHYLRGKVTFGKVKQAQDMKKHCDRIADLNDQMAAEYEELAKGEEAAAM